MYHSYNSNSPLDVKDVTSMTPLMKATANEHKEVNYFLYALQRIYNIILQIKVVIEFADKTENTLDLCIWALQHGYTVYFKV